MRTCLIPLRSGSKRLENKNVLDFFGFPIFVYPLMMAVQSNLFDKIILAYDSEYKELVKKSLSCTNEITLYERKKENSRDESGLIDLVREVVEDYVLTGEMCLLYSTSVLATANQIEEGFKKLYKYDCVFPVIKQNDEICCDDCSAEELHIDWNPYTVYCHADSWFLFNIKPILKINKIIQNKNGYITLKDYECQPVHTQEDIEDLKKKFLLMRLLQENEHIKYMEKFANGL